MNASQGLENATETLQLLFQVLNGDSGAIEQVDPYLSQRSQWRARQQVRSYAAPEAASPQAPRSSQVDTPETGSFSRRPLSTHARSPASVSFSRTAAAPRSDYGYPANAPSGFGASASGSSSKLKSSEARRPHEDFMPGECPAREAPATFSKTSPNFFQPTGTVSSGSDWTPSRKRHGAGQPSQGSPLLRSTTPKSMHAFREPPALKARGPAAISQSGSLPNLHSSTGSDWSPSRRRHGAAPPSRGSPLLRSTTPSSGHGPREPRQMKATGVGSSVPYSPNSTMRGFRQSRTLKATGAETTLRNGMSKSLQQSGSGIVMAGRPSSRHLNLDSSVASLAAAGLDPLEAHISNVSAAQKTAAEASAHAAEEAERLAAAARAAASRSSYLADLSDAAREAAHYAAAAKQATDKYNQMVTMMPPGTFLPEKALTSLEEPARDSQSSQKPVPAVPAASSSSSSSDDSAAEDDSSNDDEEHLSEMSDSDVEEHEIERGARLREPVTLPVFQSMLTKLDMNEDEASNIYDGVCQDLAQKGTKIDPSVGAPLEEFLDSLHIDPKDDEGIQSFLSVFKSAKEEPRSRYPRQNVTPSGKQAVEKSVFDKMVRYMELNRIPTQDAYKVVEAAPQFLSKAEYEMLESLAFLPQELQRRVERFILEPPCMNSSAGQTSCKEICVRQVTDIINACSASGTKFTDPEWDIRSVPTDKLYVDGQCPGFDCTVAEPAKYKRLSSIVKNAKSGMSSLFGGFSGKRSNIKPIVFKGSVAAGDIIQGQIGTCFLLGAIGAIASQREESFQKIFIKYDVDVGVYGCRFCVDGEWTHVIVDDWMPVDANGDLLYARCKDPQEVWVPVLEKAFCKLHSCYEMCDGGRATEAIITFFGGVAGFFHITEKHRKNPELYFKLLRNAHNKGWLLTTSFVANPGRKSQGQGKCGEDMLACGLVGGHAYSVLDFAEANGHQLICCRNPWGSGEWTGKWSDHNQFGEWTEEMISVTGFTKRDDGKFWMSIGDFVFNSGGVDYARSFGPNWKKVTHYAHFQNRAFEATAKRNWKGRRPEHLSFSKGDQIIIKTMKPEWWSGELKNGQSVGYFPGRFVRLNERSVLRFDLTALPLEGSEEPITMIVMLMQRNAMMQRRYIQLENGLNYKDTSYPQVGLLILDPEGKVHVQRKRHSRCVWAEVTCSGGGLWRVYAYSGSGDGAACFVRTYIKGGTLSMKEVPGTKFEEVASFMVNSS